MCQWGKDTDNLLSGKGPKWGKVLLASIIDKVALSPPAPETSLAATRSAPHRGLAGHSLGTR